jgi:hypothetical protein
MENKITKILLFMSLLSLSASNVFAEFVDGFPEGCAFATLGQSLPNSYLGYGRIQWMGSSFAFQYIDQSSPGPFAIAEIADNLGLVGQSPEQVTSIDLMNTPRDNFVVAQILDRSYLGLAPIVVCISPVFVGHVRAYQPIDFGDDYWYAYRRYRFDDWGENRWRRWDRWRNDWRGRWKGRWRDKWQDTREKAHLSWKDRRHWDRDRDRDWDTDKRLNKRRPHLKPRPKPLPIRPGEGDSGIRPRPERPVRPTPDLRPERPVKPTPDLRPEKPVRPAPEIKPLRPIRPAPEIKPTRPTRPVQELRPERPTRDAQRGRIDIRLPEQTGGSRHKINIHLEDDDKAPPPRLNIRVGDDQAERTQERRPASRSRVRR